MTQLEAEKNALYEEVMTAERIVVKEGHQHLSGSGVQEIITFFLKEKQKLESEVLKQERKVSVLEEEIDRTNFEHRRRKSPSAKRQDLEDELLSIEEALSKKRQNFDTVVERLALKCGKKYQHAVLLEEIYRDSLKALQEKSDKEKLRWKQQISVQADQYEKEIDKLRQVLKSHTTSTEALNVTHEGRIKRLKSEKETLSKSLTSVKINLESVKSQRGELETTIQNMKLELN